MKFPSSSVFGVVLVTLLATLASARAESLSGYLDRTVKKVQADPHSRKLSLDELRSRLEATHGSEETCQVFRTQLFSTPTEASLSTLDGYRGKVLITKLLAEQPASIEGDALTFREGLALILEDGDATFVAYELKAEEPRHGNWDPRNLNRDYSRRTEVLEFKQGALVWAGLETYGMNNPMFGGAASHSSFRCGQPL